MKKHQLLFYWMGLLSITVAAQEPVFHMTYNLIEEHEYWVPKEIKEAMTVRDEIALMGKLEEQTIQEVIYADGYFQKDIFISYPHGTYEEWQEWPEHIRVTPNSIINSLNQKVLSETTIDYTIIPPEEYLSTYTPPDPFQLPLSSEEVQSLEEEGYTVSNNDIQLEIANDTSSHYYNLETMYEEHVIYKEGKTVKYEAHTYTPGDYGQWFPLMSTERAIVEYDSNCIEKVRTQHYRNFNRYFQDPTLAPETGEIQPIPEIAGEYLPPMSIDRVSPTEGLRIISEHSTPVHFVIYTMRGTPVRAFAIHPGTNTINTQELDFGMYILQSQNEETAQQRIIFNHSPQKLIVLVL